MSHDPISAGDPPRIYVIHENDAWVAPLRRQFESRALPYAEWFLDEGVLDLRAIPPQGVFYNRMSASSHTRDHRYAAAYAAAVLAWLKPHGRTVVNGERALQREVTKVAHYNARAAFDIETPATRRTSTSFTKTTPGSSRCGASSKRARCPMPSGSSMKGCWISAASRRRACSTTA
jgi:hypothetical protein